MQLMDIGSEAFKRLSNVPQAWHAFLRVPILDVSLLIVIADEIAPARKLFEDIYGEAPNYDAIGLASYKGPHFALFFERASLDAGLIGHEVFHITHRILEWRDVRFDRDNHEMAAMLNGWLHDEVHKAWKEEIEWMKLRTPVSAPPPPVMPAR